MSRSSRFSDSPVSRVVSPRKGSKLILNGDWRQKHVFYRTTQRTQQTITHQILSKRISYLICTIRKRVRTTHFVPTSTSLTNTYRPYRIASNDEAIQKACTICDCRLRVCCSTFPGYNFRHGVQHPEQHKSFLSFTAIDILFHLCLHHRFYYCTRSDYHC